jgi:hypothetical protein
VALREIKGDAVETARKMLERMIWCMEEREKKDMFIASVAIDV